MDPTILISDDEPAIAAALTRLARREGLGTLVDTTADNVLTLAREHHPAVILLDVNQRQDGRDLLAALKADERTRDIKVVMVSGRDDQFTRHTCFELGADDFVAKPFDGTFMARIARLAHVAAATPRAG
ncbi:MAG: two-component system response regulator [Myxococcales bacterium]